MALLTARALVGRTMGVADDQGNDRTNADVSKSGLQMGFWIQRLLADVACLLDFPIVRGGRTLDAAAWIVDVVGRTDRGADGFRVAVEPRADAAGRDSDDGRTGFDPVDDEVRDECTWGRSAWIWATVDGNSEQTDADATGRAKTEGVPGSGQTICCFRVCGISGRLRMIGTGWLHALEQHVTQTSAHVV
ncbi:hypothetical protein ACLOJK_032320 [Asimina triloba]